MTSERRIDKRYLIPGLALLAMFVIGAEAPLFAQGRAQATRSGGSGSSAGGSSGGSAPAPRAVSQSSGTAPRAVSRGATKSGGVKKSRAVNTRRSSPASRGRARRGHGSHRHHYNIGIGFGYGGYWGYGHGYYSPFFYSPFYWGVPYYGGPYYGPRRAYRSYELGALDLNVRPKKTEVYLDGQLIGRAGQFDGFPDHLWLEQGTYELIFYRPGLATERRVLSVYPGVVVDVRLRLAPGESVEPAELSQVERTPRGAMAEVRSAYKRQTTRAASAPEPAAAELDTRASPGRLRLSVLPADASVYLDGRLLGSGDELGRLHAGLVVDAGSHLLEVVRPGYATARRKFAVEEGAELELEVLLESG